MKRIVWIRALLVAALCIFGCFALFGCGSEPQAPEVKDVALTAEEGLYGVAGEAHRLHYTVPEGCEVTASVELGGKAATAEDFTCLGEEYIFYTAGEYTVTVYAAKDGMLGRASVKLTIAARAETLAVGNVSIKAAAGETYGRIGALHLISYEATAGCEVSVTVQKDGAAATDAVYDAALQTLVFGAAGNYTVTVTAARGSESASGSAEIEVAAFDPPTVSLALGKRNVKEEEGVALEREAVYAEGDCALSEQISANYRRTGGGKYRPAEADEFTVIGDTFIPYIAGEWEVIFHVESRGGASGEASAKFTCNPADLTLAPVSASRARIATDTPTELAYRVEGAADKYTVSFDTHGNSNVTAVAGGGYSVRVTASEVDYFTVTVVYTHKTASSVTKSVDLDVYSVESLTYAPAWGEDPFDGMPSEVLTSMGHLLYFDAKSCGGAARELTGKDASFEVLSSNISSSASAGILYAADNREYPYLIVSNFGNNTATGSFTLKMTVTDPYTHYSAVAAKQFTVTPTTNSNSTAPSNIQSYIQRHADFFDMGAMDYSILGEYARENMVLTKTGTIMQRTNPNWSMEGHGPDFARMGGASASADCTLEFSFELLGVNPDTGAVGLGIGLRTGDYEGWAGFFDLRAVNGKLAIAHGFTAKSEAMGSVEMPAAVAGAKLSVRIDRRVSGNSAVYVVYVKTAADAPYAEYMRLFADVSTAAGNIGANVAAFQFTHRNAGGCYIVDGVKFTDFGA